MLEKPIAEKAEYVDRKETCSVKWDALKQNFGSDGLMPLWVADMDFRVDSHITDAIAEYMEQRRGYLVGRVLRK